MLPETVVQKLDALPVQPGVYLFKDKKGVVVYVGKAKSLRSRVRSYFQDAQGDERAFIPVLQRTIGDLDTIVTANEKEATILENNLIKEYRPRYNIKLRDDKDFITLRLASGARVRPSVPPTMAATLAEEVSTPDGASPAPPAPPSSPAPAKPADEPVAADWPRLEVVRRPTPDGARYFGPYHSATAARRTLHLVNKYFQLRTCSDIEFASRRRPCLQHQIKRCPAPCVRPVDRGWYREQVEAVAKFLEGRHDELSDELVEKMRQAARDMRFELAAVYRDQLRAIEKVREEQRVVTIDDVDRDVVGIYREGELVEIALLYVRAGKLADVITYSMKQVEIPEEEVIAAFVAQHYGASLARPSEDGDEGSVPTLVPHEVILPFEPEGIDGISEWLSERARHRVALLFPKRGHRVELLQMANENARHSFVEKQRRTDDVQERLRDLQERLRLPVLPRRIECCDISHLGGGDTVGAVVAMFEGELDKKHYRTFNVRGDAVRDQAGQINDDYGAMYEVLARRFRRAITAPAEPPSDGSSAEGSPDEAKATASAPAEDEAPAPQRDNDWELPDLFVVDGGRGQLAVALAAAHDLGLHDLCIVGLAKERETPGPEAPGSGGVKEKLSDRVYLPGQKNPIPLKSSTTSLFLLARLRDEAHRFSNRARMRIGKKRRFGSPLDGVKGLGQKAKKALLTHVGNLAAIRAADDATLLAVPGVTARHVRALRTAFPATTPPLGIEPQA
ncbi:MAG TPA: excinuclease ABC subunit UvrC [Polyangiaceae bacterium]|jgi:excinuclease ABC subunit C|nr:excinuclease ABC subunit UvrC [Polyangiaceae bacterium]